MRHREKIGAVADERGAAVRAMWRERHRTAAAAMALAVLGVALLAVVVGPDPAQAYLLPGLPCQ